MQRSGTFFFYCYCHSVSVGLRGRRFNPSEISSARCFSSGRNFIKSQKSRRRKTDLLYDIILEVNGARQGNLIKNEKKEFFNESYANSTRNSSTFNRFGHFWRLYFPLQIIRKNLCHHLCQERFHQVQNCPLRFSAVAVLMFAAPGSD